jgi:hypothetical protein
MDPDAADAWLCAYASVNGGTVVTQEVPGNSKNRIKLPNALDAFGIRYMNVFDFLHEEEARFILAP